MLMHLNTEELALSLVISIVLPISGNEKSLDLKATWRLISTVQPHFNKTIVIYLAIFIPKIDDNCACR